MNHPFNQTLYEALLLREDDSDDPDTQTVCAVDNGTQSVVMAANMLPPGVDPTKENTSRPDKYNWINHAEKRVLCKAARRGYPTEGAVMYLNWYPCANCASCISEAGIAVLYCDQDRYEERKNDPRYDFSMAADILQKGGVEVRWVPKETKN
jgi:dCMP deaminase